MTVAAVDDIVGWCLLAITIALIRSTSQVRARCALLLASPCIVRATCTSVRYHFYELFSHVDTCFSPLVLPTRSLAALQLGVLYTVLVTIAELLFMYFIVGPLIRSVDN